MSGSAVSKTFSPPSDFDPSSQHSAVLDAISYHIESGNRLLMALTLLYPDPCKGVEELLSEGPQIYNYVQVVTSTYMSNSQTELSQDKIPTNPSQSSPDSRIGATL